MDILQRIGDEKCALRLVPLLPALPKLRVRGKTLKENLLWFNEQKINPADYKVEVIPHSDETTFSAIFIVGEQGIWGKIVPGPHWQLTQGFYEEPPATFIFDFTNWHFSGASEEIKLLAKEAVSKITVYDDIQQMELKQTVDAEFVSQGYLKGYFEFVVWPKLGISFIDYNRLVGEIFVIPNLGIEKTSTSSGICASPGKAQGKAKIVLDLKNTTFSEGDILICPMTTVDYLPLMKKCSGIITAQGTLLSHAAIVARELKKPCLIGVKDIFEKVKDGDMITLDADNCQIIH
ncbi:MAG: PEP-utilizing enzyme [Candidatus Magasanikbacteria bacterium]|nr:PEP-utilizing enzyme [Candidatus Magasanikbacteria bacterium]